MDTVYGAGPAGDAGPPAPVNDPAQVQVCAAPRKPRCHARPSGRRAPPSTRAPGHGPAGKPLEHCHGTCSVLVSAQCRGEEAHCGSSSGTDLHHVGALCLHPFQCLQYEIPLLLAMGVRCDVQVAGCGLVLGGEHGQWTPPRSGRPSAFRKTEAGARRRRHFKEIRKRLCEARMRRAQSSFTQILTLCVRDDQSYEHPSPWRFPDHADPLAQATPTDEEGSRRSNGF